MKILIADDSGASRYLLKRAVQRLGHECLQAEDGLQAWDTFKRLGAEVVISDWLMPKLDGDELCRRIRSDPDCPYVYFVMLTSLEDKEYVLRAMHAGVDDYLTKPLDQNDLEMRLIAASRVTALHHRIREQQQEIQNEIDLAASIQMGLLPERPPEVPGLDLAGRCVPAASAGGDYYDFMVGEQGRVTLLIADVAGHSLGSALLTAMTRSVVRREIGEGKAPAAVLRATNRVMFGDLVNAELFVTLFCACWDPAERSLTFANGGHNPPLLRRANGEVVELDGDGAAIGFLEDLEFEEQTLALAGGDSLLLYTDGVIEACDADGAPFGEEHLTELVGSSAVSPAELVDAIEAAVREHAGQTPQQDDITLVAGRVRPAQ